jgi:hypothetical protein
MSLTPEYARNYATTLSPIQTLVDLGIRGCDGTKPNSTGEMGHLPSAPLRRYIFIHEK